MPASLIVPVAGRYLGTYTPPGGGALLVGICNDNGFELQCSIKGQEINETDAFGLSLIDGIYRGADWRLTAQVKEYKASNVRILWPWGMGAQEFSPLMGVIGRRWSDVAGSMNLAVAAGTPAVSHPNTLTAGLCIISPNSNLNLFFTSKVREVPLQMILLPYDTDGGGNLGWFSTT